MTPPASLPVRMLQSAASFAMSLPEVRPAALGEAIKVELSAARLLLDKLARWEIVTPGNGATAHLTVILPSHEPSVLRLIEAHDGHPPYPSPLHELLVPGLTAQRRAVLDLVAEGWNNDDIGEALHRSRSTIKTQIGQMCQDLGARNRTHLITVAHAQDLLPNPYTNLCPERTVSP